MNILDIDLDFFLSDRVIYDSVADPGKRLEDSKYSTWAESEVNTFFKKILQGSSDCKVPIRVVENHDEVFISVIECEFTDINLYHIDAHNDLEPINCRWYYNDYINKPIAEREALPLISRDQTGKKYLFEGNYISFLLACERLKSVTYITNIAKSWNDKPCKMFCKGLNENLGILQMTKYKTEEIFDVMKNPFAQPEKFLSVGPEVHFCIEDFSRFISNKIHFDYAFLSQSPRYTPKSSDDLIPIILKFFDLDE